MTPSLPAHLLDPGDIGRTEADLPAIGPSPEASRLDLLPWWPAERRGLPLELEIGSGKGTFLVQQATDTPDVNYLGIEWAREYWRQAADRLRRHGLMQVRLLHADATEFVRWYCGDGIFSVVHIYFPDPWPKKRHHKRRSVQAPFLRELHRTLVPGGRLNIVTDHADYWTWIEAHAAMVADVLERGPFVPPASAGDGEVVGTNFERKYREEGRSFHGMSLRAR